MRMIKKSLNFFRVFSKNLTVITIGSLFIHFIVMIVNVYASKTGTVSIDSGFFDIIFSGIMYPVVMAYGILIFITLSLYQKLVETEEKLKKEKEIKSTYEKALCNMQKISGIVMGEISSNNNEIVKWVKKKELKGTAPSVVAQASLRIGKALETLSYSMFVLPYSRHYQTVPLLEEQPRVNHR